ncbi:MAG: oxygenase MpaB family protein [Chloroflexota bacterium]
MSSRPPVSTAITFPAFQMMLDSDPTLRSGPDSITWRVNGERVLILGWGRAVLMQLAHPLVAEGVARHSSFSRSFQAKYGRFQRTLTGMLRLTFGTPYEVWQTAHSIDLIHAGVHGQLADSAHTHYSARYADLLKWVHATFVDSMLKTYALYIGPLSIAEQNDYLHKSSIIAPLLGAPQGYFPESVLELESYLNTTLERGGLTVSNQTRAMATYILEGLPIPILGYGIAWSLRLSTAALLPSSLRSAYGLNWSFLDEIALQSSAQASRQLHHVLPAALHRWSLATSAKKKL